MNILVTGGAGFIGSHVCEALLDRGDAVICVDNFNSYYDPKIKEENIKKKCIENPNFKLYRYDITNQEQLKNLVFAQNKIDKIIHLAASAGVRASLENPSLFTEVNVKGVLNILELARECKIKNLIFGSSSSVYGVNSKVPFSEDANLTKPISPYAATKIAGESLCHAYHHLYGLNITCLRFFTVYGPRGRPDMAPYKFTKIIDEGKEIPMYGDGSSKRDYTYVSDVVAGILSALDKDFKFEIINLGESKTIELKYFISVIENALGKEAKIKQLPMPPGDVPITYADISKAKKLLGYNPKVLIEEGMRNFVRWYKNGE